jgi:aldose 1-epimerase
MVPAVIDPSQKIVTDFFGNLKSGEEVNKHTLSSAELSCSILDFGAVVQTLELNSNTRTRVTPLILNYPSLTGYEADPYYMGCMVGRTAGRIGGSAYVIDGKQARLTSNEGKNHLHGGTQGFSKKLWSRTPTPPEHAGECAGPHITLSLISPDGDEGHPGDVHVWVTYEIRKNSLLIHSLAKTKTAAHVNLTNHMYFNLGGKLEPIDEHRLFVSSEAILETNQDHIATGRIVAPPPALSWTTQREIGAQAIDHTYVLKSVAPAAKLSHPSTGIEMTIITDQPVMQVYTGDYLAHQGRSSDYANLNARFGICLETQQFPNAPNCPEFPSTRIDVQHTYRSKTEFSFNV